MDRLGTRVTAMLSVALLPVGMIALFQTRSVISQADELARTVLISETRTALEFQNDVVQQGFAAARVLGGAVLPMMGNDEDCIQLLQGFTRSHPDFILASFINADGVSTCNSSGEIVDLSQSPLFAQMSQRPAPRIAAQNVGNISGEDVVLIMQPVLEDNQYAGHVTLSLPASRIQFSNVDLSPAPRHMLLINADNDVVVESGDAEDGQPDEDPQEMLPAYRDLSSFHYRAASVFSTPDRTGTERFYTLVPIMPGVVSGLAVWDEDVIKGEATLLNRAALAFPILMWAISLIVAFFAVHRLVIRHVRALRDKMRLFGIQGVVPDFGDDHDNYRTPAEIRQMEDTFYRMVQRITHDTAELENNLHEKNVLLKEVHHRVKNNLQLIASIMNMEIRKAGSAETKATLRRVQDRILGLATVHSNLYHTSRLSSLSADSLLQEILQHTLTGALPRDTADITVEIDEAILSPDQAVPLSLLTTEAATNAVKYLGKPEDGSKPWVRATLLNLGGNRIALKIENSKGPRLRQLPDQGDGGLGTQLINAFAAQLGSRVEITETDRSYALSITVEVTYLDPEASAT